MSAMTKFVLPIAALDFSASLSHVNGSTNLGTSMRSVVRALVTTGHLPAFIKPFDDYRAAGIRMRVALGQAHLMVTKSGGKSQLAPSPEWARLDPTEKAFAAYFIGSAMAKLVAGRLLSCPLLLHVSMYEKALGIEFDGGRRPDFVGPTWGGDWIVVESKGRSRLSRSVLNDAKTQAESISSINGSVPSACIASGTRFNKSLISVEMIDPPANPEGTEVNVSDAEIFRTYYAPIAELLGERGETISVQDTEVSVVAVPELDITVGLYSRLVDEMRTPAPFANYTMGDVLGRSDSRMEDDQSPDAGASGDDGAVGRDGVFVELGQSWSNAE